MTGLYDAHIHLFESGYQNRSLYERVGTRLQEVDYYRVLTRQHGGEAALVVGYAAECWCLGNNAYLSRLASQHDWVYPLAFIDHLGQLDVAMLEQLQRRLFVGISLYLFDPPKIEQLKTVSSGVWRWLEDRHWLISVNGCTEAWRAWPWVLERHRTLRVLISHMGLPDRPKRLLDSTAVSKEIESVLALASYPETRIKLSGFYTLGVPDNHRYAWTYIKAALRQFGVERMLWGSDYSPHLDFIGLTETISVIADAPFLEPEMARMILGENLRMLLELIDQRTQ